MTRCRTRSCTPTSSCTALCVATGGPSRSTPGRGWCTSARSVLHTAPNSHASLPTLASRCTAALGAAGGISSLTRSPTSAGPLVKPPPPGPRRNPPKTRRPRTGARDRDGRGRRGGYRGRDGARAATPDRAALPGPGAADGHRDAQRESTGDRRGPRHGMATHRARARRQPRTDRGPAPPADPGAGACRTARGPRGADRVRRDLPRPRSACGRVGAIGGRADRRCAGAAPRATRPR